MSNMVLLWYIILLRGGGFIMYSSSYSRSLLSSSSDAVNSSVWLIVSVILAVVGGILIYFLFLSKKNEGKFKGFAGWLYDFLSFKKMFMEALLKITYLIFALYITLSSFALIGSSFVGFLAMLIIGNVVIRLVYEFSLLLLVICRNTTEMNKKLSSKKDEK